MSVPLIDAQALQEFLDKALPLMSGDDLRRVAHALELRGQEVRRGSLDWPAIWERAPATRRLDAVERGRWRRTAEELWPQILRGERQGLMDAADGGIPEWLRDWATFWLHAVDPENEPWWARWIYRPGARTGAIALVLDDPLVLEGLSAGACYEAMAQAQNFLSEVLASTHRLEGLPRAHRATVALASVYAVYMFTMASWRMTTEFTQALPPFPNVVRSLLGIERWEWNRVAGEGQTG